MVYGLGEKYIRKRRKYLSNLTPWSIWSCLGWTNAFIQTVVGASAASGEQSLLASLIRYKCNPKGFCKPILWVNTPFQFCGVFQYTSLWGFSSTDPFSSFLQFYWGGFFLVFFLPKKCWFSLLSHYSFINKFSKTNWFYYGTYKYFAIKFMWHRKLTKHFYFLFSVSEPASHWLGSLDHLLCKTSFLLGEYKFPLKLLYSFSDHCFVY